MLSQIFWQPPRRFEFSGAEKFLRLVAVVSRIRTIALADGYVSPASYRLAQHYDLS